MNYYEHHLGDYVRDTAHLSMVEDGAYRRLIDAYYTREKPLPADLKDVCRLARAITKPERDAVKVVLEEFFSQCPDGWRHKRCDAEISRYQDKQPGAQAKRENDKERQRRSRERRKLLFETLRQNGFTASWDAPTEQLQAMVSRISSTPVTQPVTRDNTANQTPDTSNQTPDIKDTHSSTIVGASQADPPDPPRPVSKTTAVCYAMRSAGMPSVNPSHPDLASLLERGAEISMFEHAARQAVEKGKTFAYAIGIVKGQLQDAQAHAKTPNNPAGTYRPNRFDPVAFVNQSHKEQGHVIDVPAQHLA
ncbi:hypothetical protein B9Z51_08765 [Limnohabitans sp. T6-5]|uniref:YdaU family protein n=1 Tax=Limnohabitans sp. T6-5 TaxID=1100724 RepID=UPI000D393A26|nr:YdaU family protein [Limnohabitans sp. T6-5]PUE09012.1 hypothetical protein B9Z51_08765 [Limnohabitans sp. T6-5]